MDSARPALHLLNQIKPHSSQLNQLKLTSLVRPSRPHSARRDGIRVIFTYNNPGTLLVSGFEIQTAPRFGWC